MKIELNSIANAFIITYEVNGKKYMDYLDKDASVDEYNNWKLDHELRIKKIKKNNEN